MARDQSDWLGLVCISAFSVFPPVPSLSQWDAGGPLFGIFTSLWSPFYSLIVRTLDLKLLAPCVASMSPALGSEWKRQISELFHVKQEDTRPLKRGFNEPNH